MGIETRTGTFTDEAGRGIPSELEEALDPAWLRWALAPASGGAEVIEVRLVERIEAMAAKLRIAVRFADWPEDERRFCLKAFLGAQQALGGETTIREADFYTRIAPHLSMRVPGCPNVILDRQAGRGIFVMDDLVAAGARFCSAREAFTVKQVAQSLDQLARLHAAQGLVEANPWLPCRIAVLAKTPHFSTEMVQQLLDDPRGETLPGRTRSSELLHRALPALAERFGSAPQRVLHGDCHAGNLYWTPDGPGFTDWQLVQRGHWALDVAYHLNAVLPVAEAEHHERDLLAGYLEAVARHGGTPPDAERAWDDYRAAQPYGFYHWAITRRVEPAIIAIFIDRLGAAVTRHDSYRMLGL